MVGSYVGLELGAGRVRLEIRSGVGVTSSQTCRIVTSISSSERALRAAHSGA